MCRYTKIIFVHCKYFYNTFVCYKLDYILFPCIFLFYIYTRIFIFMGLLLHLFLLMKLAGPYNFWDPDLCDIKRSAIALMHGSDCGGEYEMKWEPLSFLSRMHIHGGDCRDSPREGSFSWCLPLTDILFTSREYCQWASDAMRFAIVVSSFDRIFLPHCFQK